MADLGTFIFEGKWSWNITPQFDPGSKLGRQLNELSSIIEHIQINGENKDQFIW